MLLVILCELGDHVGVLDIVAILLLDPVERRLVAGRREIVNCFFVAGLVEHLRMVQRSHHSVWATRLCFPVQQRVAASHRYSIETRAPTSWSC